MTVNGPGPESDEHVPRDRTPFEFEALLAGESSGDPRLDELVSAARAPGRPHETSGVVPLLSIDRRPASRRRRVLTRLGAATVTTKLVTGIAGAALVSAAAVATTTGHLPGIDPRATPPTAVGTALSSPSHSHSASSHPFHYGNQPPPVYKSSSPGVAASPTDAVDIPTLCAEWLALPSDSTDEQQEPQFGALIAAAGSVDAVTAFCLSQAGPTDGSSLDPSVSPSAPPSSSAPDDSTSPTDDTTSPASSPAPTVSTTPTENTATSDSPADSPSQ